LLKKGIIRRLSVVIEHLLEKIIPYIAGVLEVIGVLVVVISALGAVIRLINEKLDFSKEEIKTKFSMGLAFALEFKLGAEIIKTVVVKNLDEFYILAAVTILRMIIGFVIHSEVKSEKKVKEIGRIANKIKEKSV